MVVVTLNSVIFYQTYLNLKGVKSTLVIATIFETLSLDIVGIFYLKYLVISYIVAFFKENFKTINCPIIFFTTIISFALISMLELTIKKILDCQPNYFTYKIVTISTVASISIAISTFKGKVYRHLK